jgi:glutathione-regulated potassium-efflux system ancillary protein KefG
MSRLLVYYAHPGDRHSRVNSEMAARAAEVRGITFIDLYARYPRFEIDVDAEQELLVTHDVILMQSPLFWYSTPALVKEWIDLVLEHGFAYGAGGDRLEGKCLMLALTTAGPEDAYTPKGYQHYPLRTFLTPLEQTARLCHMRFVAPYVLHAALNAPETDALTEHVEGYVRLLEAIRDDRYELDHAEAMTIVTSDSLPIAGESLR